jgi:hypothetical protein
VLNLFDLVPLDAVVSTKVGDSRLGRNDYTAFSFLNDPYSLLDPIKVPILTSISLHYA